MRWSVAVIVLCAQIASAQPAQPITAYAKREAAAHRKQAKVHLAKGQIDLAIRELEQAVEYAPEPDALMELATLYERVPDEPKALATYARIKEGKHAPAAQDRIKAINTERERREAEARAKAEAEAKAKAEEEARRKAAEAAEAARKADIERRKADDADRQRRSAEADALEARVRARAEQRHRDALAGAERADYERSRDLRKERRARGVRYLKLGLVTGAVAGAGMLVGRWQTSRIEEGGFETASDISFALTTGKIANYTAYAFGVPAVLGITAGVTFMILGRDRSDVRVSAVSTGSMYGIALSGTLP